jgi:hypothetical protein
MGVEAGKAIRARQRETATRVDRLIAKRDEHGPIGSIRRERIKAATRDGRRALRARDAAQGAVHGAEVRVGAALARIAAQGLSCNEAFEVLGLSKSVGRRLLHGFGCHTTPGCFVIHSSGERTGHKFLDWPR